MVAGTVPQRSCSLGHRGLSHLGHHGASDPKGPCRVRPAFPPHHGERALGLHCSLLVAPVLQPPRAIDVAQRPTDRATLGGI